MPYNPHGNFGTLTDTDLVEYADTGVVNTGFDYTPRSIKVEKMGHIAAAGGVAASYRQIRQVQMHLIALDMEAKMEVVPTASGQYTGLAAAAPGDMVTFSNFSTGAQIHGFAYDATKLLMMGDIKQTRAAEKPSEITAPGTWYPRIAALATAPQ